AFWPFRPDARQPRRDPWGRIATVVGRRPRVIWLVTALVLLGCTAGIVRLRADGIPQTASFLTPVDSKIGQDLLGRHFPGGAGSPTIIVARADRQADVLAATRRTPGI